MTPADQILYLLTRQTFTANHCRRAAHIAQTVSLNWSQLYETAVQHGVAPLINTNLTKCQQLGVETAVLQQFRASKVKAALLKKRHRHDLEQALAYLNERGLEAMLVKGAALDLLVYEHPWYTLSHDYDLVIRPRDPDSTITTADHDAIVRKLYGSRIECDPYSHHDVTMNGALPVDFDAIWQQAQPIVVGAQTAVVMCPEDMLIALCINSCRKRYFRLKSLCDIAETLHAYPSLQWEKLIARARTFHVSAIVYAALLAVRNTLGCPLPNHVLTDLAVPAWRRRLIQVLLRKGSVSAFSSLYAGTQIKSRRLSRFLLLPYATFEADQIGRRLKRAIG